MEFYVYMIACSPKEILSEVERNHLISIPSPFLNLMCAKMFENWGGKIFVKKAEVPFRKFTELVNIIL